MSYPLTEEQQLIQQNACEFAKEYIEPVAVEIDRDSVYPVEVVAKLAENDFFGLCFPGDFGGAEAGYLSFVLTVEEIAKVSAGVAAILVNHVALAAYSINKWGTQSQKEVFLPALCSGAKLGAFAWSEPDHAPGVGPDRLVAVKDGDNYVLNGRKCYVENGGVAGTYVVIALSDPAAGVKGLSAFIVDAGTKGISTVRNIEKMGLRACQSTELLFSDVVVPAANLLGAAGGGLALVLEAKAAANVAEGALVLGVVQAALTESANYSKERHQFGKAIASFPAVQIMLAEMAVSIQVGRSAVYSAAALIEDGERFAAEAATVKLLLSRLGTNSLIDAIQVEGGVGYCEDMSVSRLYRDVNGVFLTESSAEFAEPTIAAEVLL
jgi:alkylation response protein AidB-like acyl-CoA dehydrogenase